jgi:hypothetical protein
MRNADYTPVAQIPMVNLSAQYEAAKARREEAELRKLEYLNQFQKVRGPLAEGVRPEVDKLWQEIEKDLESGDMSFEAKKRRQQLYNNYANVTAEALDWTKELDEREATILANPDRFLNPAEILKAIEQDRTRPITPLSIGQETASLPSLSKFYRYKMKDMTPGTVASTIAQRLKTGGGIDALYDPRTGVLKPDVLSQRVRDFAAANGLSAEEEEQAIVNELRVRGALQGGIEDVGVVQALNDEQKAEYLNSYWSRVATDLGNLVSQDILTEQEKRAAELSDYGTKIGMSGRQAEREIRLRNQLENQAPPTSSVNMYAPLVSYLENNITDDLISYDEDKIVENLAPALTKLGFSVKTAGTWGNEISIENQNGESVKIKLPAAGTNKQVIRDQIVNAVINKLPVGTDNPEADRLMYINRLMKTGAIPSAQADPLGILKP